MWACRERANGQGKMHEVAVPEGRISSSGSHDLETPKARLNLEVEPRAGFEPARQWRYLPHNLPFFFSKIVEVRYTHP